MPGRYFDEWHVGDKLTHQPSRTVTETDNLMFSAMTHNMQPLHLDAELARKSEFGRILVNSTFTFSLAIGLSVADTTVGTLVANLGFDKVVTPKPTFIGDTLTCTSEVTEMRESKSRPGQGIVVFRHELTNQNGEVVLSCLRSVLLSGKPQ
ncbi:MaoC family dehydratase [Novosphingobium pentaromativorans]|uniref:MaoC-like dehydratase n=1 Tax=Novosphingobium pentaromativorans US6-1 TaxID=1088721 RepID=G6EB00_9SPHN|nr:MaoC family dehydratase [Novosphingobium pentaromativorans]AIT80549.1 dehydratase [Novosphingobium pentaromativorans US6-1]EHJ61467.1 MaoC-like dehydratase [Novosphingobium pentaromativorans US6-1]